MTPALPAPLPAQQRVARYEEVVEDDGQVVVHVPDSAAGPDGIIRLLQVTNEDGSVHYISADQAGKRLSRRAGTDGVEGEVYQVGTDGGGGEVYQDGTDGGGGRGLSGRYGRRWRKGVYQVGTDGSGGERFIRSVRTAVKGEVY